MPRVRLDDKFTYSNEYQQLAFYRHTPSNALNGNIYEATDFPLAPESGQGAGPMIVPQFILPELGNNHNQRHGNRITVTSIRLKTIVQMDVGMIRGDFNPFTKQTISTSVDRPKRWFKMRYMVIQWDNDYVDQIGNRMLYGWFKRTFCQYTNPITDPEPDTWGGLPNAPVSVHSNVMHMTTPFTSKFNILCDKCITLSSYKPQLSLDITIPMNKTFLFDETDSTYLISPCIWLVIFPPMSEMIDMDPLTSSAFRSWNSAQSATYDYIPIADVYNFTKLSFIDL